MENVAHQLSNCLIPFFEIIILGLNIFSIIVLVLGIIIAGIDFTKTHYREKNRLFITKENNFIKNVLGSYILLSLEILIAADIIESIIKPTFQDLFKLAILVVIRTVISYFLHQEIEDTLKQETFSSKKE